MLSVLWKQHGQRALSYEVLAAIWASGALARHGLRRPVGSGASADTKIDFLATSGCP